MNIIVYGSKYGTSKKYAEELSKRINAQAVSYKNAPNLEKYDTIIYIGAVQAGSIIGLKKTFSKFNSSGKKIIIASVSLADAAHTDYSENIRNGIKRQLPANIYQNAKIFFLRGGIFYSSISFMHKTLLNMLYKKAVSMKEEDKTPDIKSIIETHGKDIDFSDFSTLAPIINEI